ncbi:zinc finger CCCH domain-containing protein 61 isoform X2 [Arabidopsis lyrata subsp. lyrata]|uniref:zinc finger CCCH domain-containing protein 61 isoform X2 n=1 Tax=Arabidopsis lyrata subsp. lyrata TaxID=81972 RepID=UPI000A29BD53|nr:zinc finger CCCH domain-containing protein 61 isoform X2 [Arabidopsis lyrata subsp. lyrata]|eukprot:XP_020871650.1 zinc finger CCCH domain-containing protein 61 isoform X2 [Arabidopsis lyrata subsp. lyrata]
MDVEHHKSGHISRPTVDIPPRKLLSSAKSPSSVSSPLRNYKEQKDYCYDSDSEDPYAGDHFRMYEFKIRRCTRSRSHDWTDCPFSHPGEKARRRDPRRFHYTGEVCPEFSRHGGDCSRGDECGFAHGVFECWLHPSRYRTEACKDGKHCKRKVCFFAHSPRQLRVLPPSPGNLVSGCGGSPLSSPASVLSSKNNRCCLFCSHSPTSTLLGLSISPSSSPPLSPADKAAAFSRLSRRRTAVLNELISSLDSFSLTEALAASSSSPVTMPTSTAAMIASSSLSNHLHHRLPPWLDVGDRDLSLSSTPSNLHGQLQPPPSSFFSDEFTPRGGQLSDFTAAAAAAAAAKARDKNSYEVGSSGDLDLGWVNDLLT